MAQALNVVGKVIALEGHVFARATDGTQRELTLGAPVYEGEVLVAGADGQVELAFDDGGFFLLRPNEVATLDATVFGDDWPDINNAALLPPTSESADINDAIANGDSLDKLLEETAAGLSGGGGAEEGHSFVQLMRISESTSPQSFAFDASQTGQATDAEKIASAGDANPEPSDPATNPTTPAGQASFSINDVTVNEAEGTATFTVTLSASSQDNVSVNFNTSDVTTSAGLDYSATSGTLLFAPGVTSQTITVAIRADTIVEGDETYQVNLSAPTNASISDAFGLGTIEEEDNGGTLPEKPVLSVSSTTVTEGAGFAEFLVSLSAPSTQSTTVDFSLVDESATGQGVDFGGTLEISIDGGVNWAIGSTATIAAGTSSVLVRTPIVDDTVAEGTETFRLNATTSNVDAHGIGTIVDNDLPTMSINNVTVSETDGTATFTVTLSGASAENVSVHYNTSNDTAIARQDYGFATGTLTFAPGVTSQTITIKIVSDNNREDTEDFHVNLSAPSNATIANGVGIGTILDVWVPPPAVASNLSVSNVTVHEDAGFAQFSVDLSSPR
ncbi:MAG: retention module-containing protein, partial [Pseudomonadota bacterium]